MINELINEKDHFNEHLAGACVNVYFKSVPVSSGYVFWIFFVCAPSLLRAFYLLPSKTRVKFLHN